MTFAAVVFTSALGAVNFAAAAWAPGITVYNAQYESLAQAWVDGFTRETAIQLTLRSGDDSEISWCRRSSSPRRRVPEREFAGHDPGW